MSRILITGKNGQVGFELLRVLPAMGDVIGTDRAELDLADPDSIRRIVRDAKPELIVNAAAYTAVDQAESEPERAFAVNSVGPGILAEEAKRLGAAMIHFSTDYVFDGEKSGAYTEVDEPRPLSVYGRSKLAGEEAIQAVDPSHLILRASWIYGARGRNFLLTILRMAREREELAVVNDQIGAPTWSRAIASAIRGILASLHFGEETFRDACAEKRGVYNVTAAGQTSWYGFAAAILAHASGAPPGSPFHLERLPALKPIATEQYPTAAKRPRNSVLSNARQQRAFGIVMPDWRAGLMDCIGSGS